MRIAQNLILLPVFVQVLLTMALLPLLAFARARSMRDRGQSPQDMALAGKTDWNVESQKIAASFANQFELPVLFYVAAAFALITRMVDTWMLALASLFVILRIVHAAIHVGPNVVAWRSTVFALGAATVVTMWLLLVVRIAQAGF